jgi:serine phosphatase RsbU (regulator of sigma subunit)
MPRDIVSGDFYYVYATRRSVFIAAGDCTGHGVPGALLSILGISFLNEIVQCRSDHKANRILNQMRERVMKALRQKGEKTDTPDSIDVGLCILDRESGQIQYSGANRPLIMVRNGILTEFKPDKMTIGVAPLAELPFNNQIINSRKGDTFYMFSDGYSDQFGGPDERKFKLKQLKSVIETLTDMPMSGQKDVLERTFLEWKGNVPQIDDVMIFGFRV